MFVGIGVFLFLLLFSTGLDFASALMMERAKEAFQPKKNYGYGLLLY